MSEPFARMRCGQIGWVGGVLDAQAMMQAQDHVGAAYQTNGCRKRTRPGAQLL